MHSALRKISVIYAFEIKSNVLHVDVTIILRESDYSLAAVLCLQFKVKVSKDLDQ